jgi:hypothetical protein
VTFPYTLWEPLSVAEVQQLFRGAPFAWGLAGGYAVEQFLGTSIRTHADIDIVVFRDEQHQLYQWLSDWRLYAADPPGTLRLWNATEWLTFGIHDIWAHHTNARAWQLQMMVVETDGDNWFSCRHPMIRGSRTDLLVNYHGILCIRIEVQLLYKAKGNREKDRHDFHACLPLLTAEAKAWLKQALQLAHPEGHAWLLSLS